MILHGQSERVITQLHLLDYVVTGAPRLDLEILAQLVDRLSMSEGSTAVWRKNSGAISGPPVSKRPCTLPNGTERRAAFQTFICGCAAKNGAKYFSSERRIQVAMFGIAFSKAKQRPLQE